MRGATVGDQVRPQSELISIHAPLAGCDIDDLIPYANNAKFQSTHPSRGATRAIWIPHSWRKYFNPRAPCGARQRQHDALLRQPLISIHAPLAGRDSASMTHFFASPLFQSTRPMRGATVGPGDIPAIEKPFQSTHPMRGATSNTPRPPIDHGISIHAPHAGRDQLFFPTLLLLSLFQSTRPMRGATQKLQQYGSSTQNFNPRAPCGARLPSGP